jgi:DNA-binding MarR family transcriptional regulator
MHTPNVVSAWVLDAHDALLSAARLSGLDPRELAALTLIATHEGCSVEWLRRRVGLTQSGTVRLVDRLEAARLARRAPAGGRGVALSVTEEGAGRLARWHVARARTVDHLLGALSASARAGLTAALAATLRGRRRDRSEADVACRSCDWPACGSDCPVDRSVPAGR